MIKVTCSRDECDRKIVAWGLCGTHYRAAKRAGIFGGSVCSVDGCDRPFESRGWCRFHYERWSVYGDPLREPPPREETFWRSVEKAADCWFWRGVLDKDGYGQVRFKGRQRRAHRVAYELVVGPIPEGLELDHLCRVHDCVNPAHLEPVTTGENLRRGETFQGKNARKVECVNGHPFDAENTGYRKRPGGGRYCKACNRILDKRRRCARD